MKNSLFLAIICLLTCSSYVFTASADNYFTLRTATDTIVNDTLRINPNWAGGFCKMYVPAHFDGRLDHWYLKMVHPGNMSVYDGNIVDLKVAVGPAMTIEYLDQNGDSAIHNAVITTNIPNVIEQDTLFASYFASTINVLGYWNHDEVRTFDSYGTVKWEAGYYDYMFAFSLFIPSGCVNADLTLDLTMTSTSDARGNIVNNDRTFRTIHLYVGYLLGDVNGDGFVSIADVSTLIDWLLNGISVTDPYILAAADVDGDGVVEVSDISTLIDMIMNM